ncbi:MAG: choice-of-anchor Q domain-containing protein [Xanthomonadales bacterium]|jgi:hypothetical protein|nr:choice-of-anchor Q domain-containing protein [Xanthomonadales bacterium]
MKCVPKTIIFATALLFVHTCSAYSNPKTLDDWSDVVSAIEQANESGKGIISLAARETIDVAEPLPPITGEVVLEGNGATLLSDPDYEGAIFRVESSGTLKVNDLHITGFNRTVHSTLINYSALIENHGNLDLARVTLSLNRACDGCRTTLPLIGNHGEAALNNVTIYNNGSRATQNIGNCGRMTLLNSTIVGNFASSLEGHGGVLRGIPAALSDSISGCEPGEYIIGNTLLDNVYQNCNPISNLLDLGGNFDSDGSCGFDPEINVIDGSSDYGHFGYQGGLVPTLGLESGSGALDIGINNQCSAMDARFANRPVKGSISNESHCDSGAFEYGGGFGNSGLEVNGMNGLWFSREFDGHYVHIIRVSTDRVYINWTTFDQLSNQLWVYAVSETVNSANFSATAYINEGGQMLPGGAPEGHVVRKWGEIEIELEDCTSGNFKYNADAADIGEGEFQLDRLAFYEGGGCSSNN